MPTTGGVMASSGRLSRVRPVVAVVVFLALFLAGQAGLVMAVRHGLDRGLGVEVPVAWVGLWGGFPLSIAVPLLVALVAFQAVATLPRMDATAVVFVAVAVSGAVVIHAEHVGAATGDRLRSGEDRAAPDNLRGLATPACVLTPQRRAVWIVGPVRDRTVTVDTAGVVTVLSDAGFEFTRSSRPTC